MRWIFGLLALVVPVLMMYQVNYHFRTPPSELSLNWQTGVIRKIPPGSFAEFAGLTPGDVITSIDGVPFPEYDGLIIGNYLAEIERGSQRFTLEIPIPFVKIEPPALITAFTIALSFWGLGVVLLLRRFWRTDTRLLFLTVQTFAVAALLLLTNPPMWTRPFWMAHASVACFHLSALFLLHYTLTFPVRLGTPRRRRLALSVLYGLTALLFLIRVGSSNTLWARLSALLGALIIGAAVIVLSYVYFRLADPDARRRLRLIVLGTALAVAPSSLYSFFLAVTGASYQAVSWWMRLSLPFAPLCYLYAIARHNLFGIDRILNRAMVYVLLSLSIFALYLGPLLFLYRFLPDDLFLQTTIVAGLTLLVSLSFNWTRTRVQRLVDHLFYGGWYDYPGVIEVVSNALARSLTREQLIEVLTRQVPKLMQLHEGRLWIRKPGHFRAREVTPPQMRFPLSFQGQVRGMWAAGPRQDGEGFTASDQRILKTLAHQAEMALNNVLLVEALQDQLAEIREAQRQLLRSREEERARLARELHDGPIQTLIGLHLQVGMLLSQEESDSPMTKTLSGARAEVKQLLSDLRQVCTELRPPMLDTLGLNAALRALAEEWSAQHDPAIQLELPLDASLRSLPDETAVNLYRVTQEGLSNVAHHAEAKQVTVRLAWEDNLLALTVQDDGQGFAAPAALHSLAAQGHYGLVGIQERVDLIGGRLTIESAPGQGATVRVVWRPDM